MNDELSLWTVHSASALESLICCFLHAYFHAFLTFPAAQATSHRLAPRTAQTAFKTKAGDAASGEAAVALQAVLRQLEAAAAGLELSGRHGWGVPDCLPGGHSTHVIALCWLTPGREPSQHSCQPPSESRAQTRTQC